MQLNLTCLYSKDLARNKQQLRSWVDTYFRLGINPLNTKLNPICHLLALLGAHHIFHVSSVKVNTKH